MEGHIRHADADEFALTTLRLHRRLDGRLPVDFEVDYGRSSQPDVA